MSDKPNLVSLEYSRADVENSYLVPAGTYVATIDDVEIKSSENAGQYMRVYYTIDTDEILDPETGDTISVGGRKFSDAIFYTGDGRKLTRLMDAIKYEAPEDKEGKLQFEPEAFIGKQVGIVVITKERNDDSGRFDNRVQRFIAPDKL